MPVSRHREFLRWIPLHNTTSSLSHQRKAILHGARTRETPEDLCERKMRREIRAIIPLVFGGNIVLIVCLAFLSHGFVKGLRCLHLCLFPLSGKAAASLLTHRGSNK